jgi:hypothetical protein
MDPISSLLYIYLGAFHPAALFVLIAIILLMRVVAWLLADIAPVSGRDTRYVDPAWPTYEPPQPTSLEEWHDMKKRGVL